MRSIFKSDIKAIVFLIILASSLELLLYANGAKMIDSPETNGGIFFDEGSGIMLVEETINFSQFEESLYYPYAKVSVDYKLKNSLDADQKFDMLFIVPPLTNREHEQTIKVIFADKDITDSVSYEVIDRIENWYPNFPHGLKEPYSQKVYDEYLPENMRISTIRTHGIKIPVTMKANSNTHLVIEYLSRGGYAKLDEYENTIYSFIYFLTPAKFWDGNPSIKLNINFPSDEESTFYSNIPMKEVSNNNYTCDLIELPEYEWMFTYVIRNGLIYGTNDSTIHTRITTLISIAAFSLVILIYIRSKNSLILILGYIVTVLFFFMFAGKLDGGFITYSMLFFLLFILIPVFYIHAKNASE